jgi:phosphoadenosine phosphosulfate reductase
MALYQNGHFVEDSWKTLEAGQDIPPSGHVIVPLDWWQAQRGAFTGSNVPIGVRIEPGTKIENFAQDIPRLSVIALAFPKFQDGRAFSTAQLLRERYGFKGELRAVGDILLDQLQMLARCGFDTFEIKDGPTLQALQEGRAKSFTRFYQPSLLPEAPAGTRPWLRQPG